LPITIEAPQQEIEMKFNEIVLALRKGEQVSPELVADAIETLCDRLGANECPECGDIEFGSYQEKPGDNYMTAECFHCGHLWSLNHA
jgi:DNA-directed RNA polymerase subunit M/transcription elongation factor TFIIS